MFASMSAQFQAVLEAARSRISNRMPFSSAPSIVISVCCGLHEGSSKKLAKSTVTIGSEDSDDIVLLDTQIMPAHVTISSLHSLFGPVVYLAATGGPIKLGDQKISDGASSRLLRLPTEAVLGDEVRIRIAAASYVREKPQTWLARTERSAWNAVAMVALTTFALVASSQFWGSRYVVHVAPRTVDQDQQQSAAVDVVTIEKKLSELGLENDLKVSALSDGIIKLSGRLAPGQMAQWQELRTWYDSVAQGRPMLTSLNVSSAPPELPPIAIVQLHEPRMLILANGNAIKPGSQIANGWRLVTITQDGIDISRGAESQKIAFAEPAK